MLYGKISNLDLAVLTSLSLGQYSKTSIGYFPLQPSFSVSKLFLLNKYNMLQCDDNDMVLAKLIYKLMNTMHRNSSRMRIVIDTTSAIQNVNSHNSFLGICVVRLRRKIQDSNHTNNCDNTDL